MKEMVHTRKVPKKCEGPKFGIGSIGKVKVLMMQELDSVSSKTKPSKTVPVSVYCCESRKRQEKMKSKCDNKKSTTSNSGNATNNRRPGNVRKKVHQIPSPHCLPMLESEDISTEKTPMTGEQPGKRRTRFVDVVDLKCGNSSEKGRPSPITNQLRRLNFSKLSG